MPIPLLIFMLVMLLTIIIAYASSEDNWKLLLIPLFVIPLSIWWMIASYDVAVHDESVVTYEIVEVLNPSGNKVQLGVCDGKDPININSKFGIFVTDLHKQVVHKHIARNFGYGIIWLMNDSYTLDTVSVEKEK